MPRKRKTRAALAGSRAPAKVPDGQEGTDLTQEEKKAKLEVLLKDFDNELQSRIDGLEEAYHHMVRDIERTLTVQLSLHIPQKIQKMKLSDFLAQGGVWDNSDCRKELDNFASQIEQSIKTKLLQPIQEENQSEDSDKPRRTTRKTRQQVQHLHQESIQNAPKPSRKAVLSKNQSMNMPPPTTGRTRKTRAVATPAHGSQDTSAWDTPLVTPKFSSRLPCTPAVGLRNIRGGERVTLMSESGSPVSAEEVTVFVPMGDKTVMIGESNLDNEAKLVLQRLREQLLKCQQI